MSSQVRTPAPAHLFPTGDGMGSRTPTIKVLTSLVLLYAILNIGTALAQNLPMLIIFCFLIGVAGSVAMTNVAGTVSDLFGV